MPNGERFDPNGLTAADRTPALGTIARITARGFTVKVPIIDRGPVTAAGSSICRPARALGMLHSGLAPVTHDVRAAGLGRP